MRFRVLTLTVLVLCCVLRLHATPQSDDPRIIINNGHDFSTPLTFDFTFIANGSGGGVFDFTNASGFDWTHVEIIAPVAPPPIICGGTAFTTCLVQLESDSTIIQFFGGPGIMNGQDFMIDLGSSGWPPFGAFEFRAFSTPVPEPSTLSFFAIGLAPLLVRRIRNR
jgi:hypothetical protein